MSCLFAGDACCVRVGDVPGPDGVEPPGSLATPGPLGQQSGAVHVTARSSTVHVTLLVCQTAL